MLTVRVAVICDFANVREGLLTIVSAGITRLYRDSLPAPFGATLALLLEVPPDEQSVPHELGIEIKAPDGRPLGMFTGAFQSEVADVQVGESLLAPFVLPIPAMVEEFGCHEISLQIDGVAASLDPLRVWVVATA